MYIYINIKCRLKLVRPSLVVERARRAWTFLNKKQKTKPKKKNRVGTRHKNVESTRQSRGKKGVGTKTPSQGGLLIDVPGLWRLKQ
jgi:hypothetical protein